MQAPLTNPQATQFPGMTLKEITEILIKEKNLHEGFFDLAIEFKIAVGGVGPTPDATMPGAMIGVSKIGLVRTQQLGPHTVDAAIFNPITTPAKKRVTSAKK